MDHTYILVPVCLFIVFVIVRLIVNIRRTRRQWSLYDQYLTRIDEEDLLAIIAERCACDVSQVVLVRYDDNKVGVKIFSPEIKKEIDSL